MCVIKDFSQQVSFKKYIVILFLSFLISHCARSSANRQLTFHLVKLRIEFVPCELMKITHSN